MGTEAHLRVYVLNNIVIVEPQIMATGLLIIDIFNTQPRSLRFK